jgi:cell wall-associated NlpC family hydrolase
MTTAVLERPRTVAKSNKAKAPAAAADGQVVFAASKSKAVTKADLKKHAAEIEAKAAEKKAAPVKAKPAPKAKAPKAPKEPKPRRVSAMWVIRTNMAEAIATNGKPATVEMISKACSDAGVPKSDATIGTIISDFMQSYLAMKAAGLIKG